jgi:alpha-glucosidase
VVPSRPDVTSLRRAHHDGSALYVDNPSPVIGDRVNVWARVPGDAEVQGVYLRLIEDGEAHFVEASVDRSTAGDLWWRAELRVGNPVVAYRFLLKLAQGRYCWLNASGVHGHDVTDAEDFRLLTFAPPPRWAEGAVVYQIFLDRFARSGARRPLPPWVVEADWDKTPVAYRGPLTSRQFYGGDLAGIQSRLDYIEQLGPDVIYLTPFFPAPSNHRYDAETFDAVDPLLGGNEALSSLSSAVHTRGMRVLGDLTTNHTGVEHDWFRAAKGDAGAPEHGFYYWQQGSPGYAAWLGHPRLPKLNYNCPALWERLVSGPRSITSRWLQHPYDLDGWRVDVANMTGRYGADDFNAEVARAMRTTMAATRDDTLLVAEHSHDYGQDMTGDGWHGAMNYAGFTKPVWAWLSQRETGLAFLGQPLEIPRSPARPVAQTMTQFLARVPWAVATSHFNLLCSHDTPRIRTVTGDGALVAVGAALLFSFPGIPMVFSGDEIGLLGANGEDSRKPFPWQRRGSWDYATLATYKKLIALRRSSPALRSGGIRWVYKDDNAMAYLREAPSERVFVLITRSPGDDIVLESAALGWSGRAENCYGGAELHLDGATATVPGDGPMAQVWRLT